MKRLAVVVGVALVLSAVPARAQLGTIGKAAGQALKAKGLVDQVKDLIITDAEEKEMGALVSAKLREKYGVVQDPAVHKYVSLVGRVLASVSSRPNIAWTFIVLDTDGVNAFAAPGGYVHITRGALALIQNEAELAGVLGHEITHVTSKHTINAVKKSKWVDAGTDVLARNALLNVFADKAYESVLENKFDRGDEEDSDKTGITLANTVGYAPSGLGAFLTRLADRNKDLKEPSGVFASHPETKSRVSRLMKLMASGKLTASATVTARYKKTITYTPLPVSAVPAAEGAAALTGGGKPAAKPAETKAADPKAGDAKATESKGKFGLGGITSKLGGEKKSTQTMASAGSRGVNPDRDAKGGSNARVVIITLTPAEIDTFRKGIAG